MEIVFCNAILYIINIDKTHFKLKDCKINRPSFFEGGGGVMRKEDGEKNGNQKMLR